MIPPSKLVTGKIIIFWDYDTQWGADRSRSPGGPKEWGELEFENTEKLLEIHAEHDILACFAVVGAAALPGKRPYKDPDQIRNIHAMGHEIASHSMYHEWLPGLGHQILLRTLRDSKDAIEQCIGNPVVSFVPPYNQPFDFLPKWSISLSERREVKNDRIDLYRLCEALRKTGYLFSRVSYSTLYERFLERVLNKQSDHPSKLLNINNVMCLRLNTPGGFNGEVIKIMERCAHAGGFVVVYGHPHSLHSGNSQDEKYLIPFLQRVNSLIKSGDLEAVLPRQLVKSGEKLA